MKGLLCWIYKDEGGDSSNGGLSSKAQRVILVDSEIGDAPFEPSEKIPAVKLVRRNIGGEYLSAQPMSEPYDEIGYMFGGCFIYSSDSRFPSSYPIPLHDRCESQKLYDTLSR